MMKVKSWQTALVFLLLNLITFTLNAQQMLRLSPKDFSLAAISATTATGKTELLNAELNKGLDNGLTINEIKECLTQLYAYCGFPRSLNAINIFSQVLDDRKKRGMTDDEGRKILPNTSSNKYEQGRKVLEHLTKVPQSRPAPGFGEFAPRIDTFLKEHLFADVFASEVLDLRQRELVTISALASMQGVESQLNSHINMGKNMGITDAGLEQLSAIIQGLVGTTQANTLLKSIGKPLLTVVKPDMMVRIAEIEVFTEHLEQYRNLLEEEANASVAKEQGVIAIIPMFQKEQPAQVKIIEIYADRAAYELHLKTPHFQKYKTCTLEMVKNLKLVDMQSMDEQSLNSIFRKLK